MEGLKKLLFLVILAMLAAIGTWRQFSAFSGTALKGAFTPHQRPLFSPASFISGDFQEGYYQYVEDLPGLKGTLVRIRNQADYILFALPHAEKIIRGKGGYLFGEENILAFMGWDFPGKYYLDVKLKELKMFQDELWRRKKILLLLVITPDKASFFPELIPDRFVNLKAGQSNYDFYSERMERSGINVIDFNRYFILAKDTSQYPLFAKTGLHWSSYGSLLAADSLIRYIEKKLAITLPQIIIDSIVKTRVPRDDDDDISSTLNLFFSIPQPELGYPSFHFTTGKASIRPPVLFIGDSYYWNWYRRGIIRNTFRNQDFWYYDKEVYPASFIMKKYTWQLNLQREMERYKIIVLLHNNNGQGYDFGFGFVDRAWPEYDLSSNNRIREIETFLTKSEENMRFYENKSKEWGVPLETVIRTDAIYAGNKELRKKK